MQMSTRLGSLVALALGVGLEGAEVGIAVWDKLVAEAADCLGMGCR